MKNSNQIHPARKSFVRLGTIEQLKDYEKEGKRVGYTVTHKRDSGFHHLTICDPENEGAEVMHGITVRPGVVAFSFALAYWEEPEPILPATPENYARHIRNLP